VFRKNTCFPFSLCELFRTFARQKKKLMPRQPRKPSSTGIFHVMMRGINHQEIFCDAEDYYQFINTLDRMRIQYDDDGLPSGTNFTLYAYCLMGNHCHLLIREREDNLAMAVKRISSSYVYYFNHKYFRDGHLFKERFKSEPVNDMAYFTTLLRYIHQNPVKAGIVEHVKDYEYSSWNEYTDEVDPIFHICDTATVFRHIPFTELEAIVNEPLPDEVCCLDYDNEKPKLRLSDDQVWQHIIQLTNTTNATDFQRLEKDLRHEALRELRLQGASVRQLERLTGISRGIIQYIKL
jgi:REP element-mobilizing transposase RayT